MSTPDLASIGIIVLAAGRSLRFQGDKRVTPLRHGHTLLQASLAQVPRCISQRIIVLRAEDDTLARSLPGSWQVVRAPHAEGGMGDSLAAGIGAAGQWQGALIGLGDMPYIASDTYLAVQRQLREQPLVVPVHAGQRGHPVGFRREFFEELSALEGDQGAQALLRKHAPRCFYLPCQDPGILRDIDTPEALAAGN